MMNENNSKAYWKKWLKEYITDPIALWLTFF